jgi:hypothetical protein
MTLAKEALDIGHGVSENLFEVFSRVAHSDQLVGDV